MVLNDTVSDAEILQTYIAGVHGGHNELQVIFSHK